MAYQVMYVSSAARAFSLQALNELLENARTKNRRLGVTGMLLYLDDSFLQVLEGERAVVEDLYETIKGDERHTGVTALRTTEVDAREFGDWHMGFRNLDGASGDRDDALRFPPDRDAENGSPEDGGPSMRDLVETPGHAYEALRRFKDRRPRRA